MIVTEKLKLNRFQPVNIPSGKELFKRFGVALGITYSGDEVAPQPLSKIDQISQAANLNESELRKEAAAARKAEREAAVAAAAAAKPAPGAPAAPAAPAPAPAAPAQAAE